MVLVFGGVNDQLTSNKFQVYNPVTHRWTEMNKMIKGDILPKRKGHSSVIVPYDNNFYFNTLIDSLNQDVMKTYFVLIFGGKSETQYHNDLMLIQINYMLLDDLFIYKSFSSISMKGDIPSPRQGHQTFLNGKYMYLFGGCNYEINKCYYNELYRLNLEAMSWEKIPLKGEENLSDKNTIISIWNKYITIGSCELNRNSSCSNKLKLIVNNSDCKCKKLQLLMNELKNDTKLICYDNYEKVISRSKLCKKKKKLKDLEKIQVKNNTIINKNSFDEENKLNMTECLESKTENNSNEISKNKKIIDNTFKSNKFSGIAPHIDLNLKAHNHSKKNMTKVLPHGKINKKTSSSQHVLGLLNKSEALNSTNKIHKKPPIGENNLILLSNHTNSSQTQKFKNSTNYKNKTNISTNSKKSHDNSHDIKLNLNYDHNHKLSNNKKVDNLNDTHLINITKKHKKNKNGNNHTHSNYLNFSESVKNRILSELQENHENNEGKEFKELIRHLYRKIVHEENPRHSSKISFHSKRNLNLLQKQEQKVVKPETNKQNFTEIKNYIKNLHQESQNEIKTFLTDLIKNFQSFSSKTSMSIENLEKFKIDQKAFNSKVEESKTIACENGYMKKYLVL